MTAIAVKFVKSPMKLFWWEWPKLAGAFSLVALLAALLAGVDVSATVVGLVLHLALDFTLQSQWAFANKPDRGLALLLHSLIAGSLPSAIRGMMVAGAVGCLTGIVVGFLSHYAIDYTRKFGCKSVALGVVLDQALHVLVLLV